MKTPTLSSLALFLGCLSVAVAVSRGDVTPTQEVLASYPYQPELVALPGAAPSPPPVVMPAFRTLAPVGLSFRDMEIAMAKAKAQRAHSLFVWELRWNTELKLVGRPSVGAIDIPWSPMTSPAAVAFSPGSIGSVNAKLQARVPLAILSW
jgi:hypothetical protein